MFGLLSIAVVFASLVLTLTDSMLDPPIPHRSVKGVKGGQQVCVRPPVKLADYRDDALVIHNEYRARHSVGPLVNSDWLNSIAQDLADKMAENNDLLKESRNGKVGESFFMSEGSSLSESQVFEKAIQVWYSESETYDYNNTRYLPQSRHFTQMVWPNTKELGVGYATTRGLYQDNTFCVCTYYPPGNKEPLFDQPIYPPRW